MGVGGNGDDMGFKHGDESGGISCPSSGVEMTSVPLYAKADPFFSSADWDPIVSTMGSNNGFSNSHYTSLVIENQGNMSDFAHYTFGSGSSFIDMAPKLMSYGGISFNRPDCGQIARSNASNKETENEGALIKTRASHEDHQVSEEGFLAASPNRKRMKPEPKSNPSLNRNKKAVEEHQKDASGRSLDGSKEQNQKKSEAEPNTGVNSRGKQPAKETTTKDNSQSEEAPEETYIHVRARRGQATNSHSLAERVRREKISERMRLLQDIVPGCNKITGKAVMLDEIINYVQSLQQQVEFLSMKLATVNPELNFDIERILSKDIHHPRGGNTPMLAGMNPSHHYGIVQGTMQSIPTTNQHFPTLPQTVLDSELQSLYQMGFISNSAVDSLAPNGRMKPEL